jgi:hypothetical protein
MASFDLGETVVKHGESRAMKIIKIDDLGHGRCVAVCVWEEEGKLRSGRFSEDQLELSIALPESAKSTLRS